MPFTYIINPPARLAILVGRGHVTEPDIVANIDAYHADPAFDPGQDHLIDVSGAELVDLTFRDAMRIVGRLARAHPQGGRPIHKAVFAPADGAFGMARLLEQVSDGAPGYSVSVHRELDAALDALGRTRADLPWPPGVPAPA